MGLGPVLYLKTDAEASAFTEGLDVTAVVPKTDFNRVGAVEGSGPTSEKLMVDVGSHLRDYRTYPVAISFNFYDARGEWESWVADFCTIFDAVVSRDDVRGGYLGWHGPSVTMAEWSDRTASLISPDYPGLSEIPITILSHMRATFEREAFTVNALS